MLRDKEYMRLNQSHSGDNLLIPYLHKWANSSKRAYYQSSPCKGPTWKSSMGTWDRHISQLPLTLSLEFVELSVSFLCGGLVARNPPCLASRSTAQRSLNLVRTPLLRPISAPQKICSKLLCPSGTYEALDLQDNDKTHYMRQRLLSTSVDRLHPLWLVRN